MYCLEQILEATSHKQQLYSPLDIYTNSVWTRDSVKRTYYKRCTIGTGSESQIALSYKRDLMMMMIYIYIDKNKCVCMYVCVFVCVCVGQVTV